MAVWIVSDTGTFVLCRVCCAPGGLVGGLGLTGHELVARRPLVADHWANH